MAWGQCERRDYPLNASASLTHTHTSASRRVTRAHCSQLARHASNVKLKARQRQSRFSSSVLGLSEAVLVEQVFDLRGVERALTSMLSWIMALMLEL